MADALHRLCVVTGGHRPDPQHPATCKKCGKALGPAELREPEGLPDVLRVAVCQVLAGMAGFADYWSNEGPTEHATRLRDELLHGGPEAAGALAVVGVNDAVLVLLAFSVWDGTGREFVDKHVEALPDVLLTEVHSLMGALLLGSPGVSAWLDAHGVRHG